MGYVVGQRPAVFLLAVAASSCLLDSAGTDFVQDQGASAKGLVPSAEAARARGQAGAPGPPSTGEEGASGGATGLHEVSRRWRASGLEPWPAAAPDPFAPGPFFVERLVVSLDLGADWRRSTAFEVVAFLPDAEGSLFEPFPIVVWGGGLALGQGHYAPAARLAASHGVAMVVAIFFDNLLDLLSDEESAWVAERIIDWIEEQTQGPWAGRVAANALGIGGHSGGAKVAPLRRQAVTGQSGPHGLRFACRATRGRHNRGGPHG